MKPYLCPVCQGRGTVPAHFYDAASPVVAMVECRACEGKGIVWGADMTPQQPVLLLGPVTVERPPDNAPFRYEYEVKWEQPYWETLPKMYCGTGSASVELHPEWRLFNAAFDALAEAVL